MPQDIAAPVVSLPQSTNWADVSCQLRIWTLKVLTVHGTGLTVTPFS
jgi:hypothetical protein